MKAIIALSGGMDSATVLAEAVHQGREVVACIGFKYGSKHNQYENASALSVARYYQLPFSLIDLTDVGRGLSSHLLKSGGAIPEGHYEADSMSQTVVPGRNMIFASVLAGIAWSRDAEEVWLGVHAGDHHIYPDCRPEFITAMNGAISLGTDHRVKLVTPYLYGNKETILKKGFELGVPYILTRTCYKDQGTACGKCGSCQERLAAFEAIGKTDSINYETRELMPDEKSME